MKSTMPPVSATLSCAAGDPEMRFGMPAGPFTSVGPVIPILLAAGGTVAVYAAVYAMAEASGVRESGAGVVTWVESSSALGPPRSSGTSRGGM